MRIIPVSSTGYSPFLLVYKQPPPIPIPIALLPLSTTEIADNTDQYLEQIMGIWGDLLKEIEIKHAKYDQKMI